MKKIDLYIIKKFLITYFFSILLIVSISVIFDITEKIDDFVEKDAPLKAIVFDYYLNFIPYFANLFSALFVFISVVFFTSKMASQTEIVAILSGGVSFNRLLVPYMISAFIISAFSFVLTGYVIPPANKKRIDFEYKYIKSEEKNLNKNIHMQIEPNLIAYVQRFDLRTSTGHQFTLEKFDENKNLISKLSSKLCRWDSTIGKWHIHNYFIREFENNEEVAILEGTKLDTSLALLPKDFSTKLQFIEALNNNELNDYIVEHRLRGTENLLSLLVERHKRYAMPFATFILTVIGLSLASRKVRGGIGLHIGIGISLSFGFILFQQVSTMFAIKGTASPFIAVWIPNFIFLIVSIFLYRAAPK